MDAKYTGEQIAAARRGKGLTQKQLAEKLMVTDKAVSKWERGMNYPDIALLKPLSEQLDISLLQLLCGEDAGAERAVEIANEISLQEKQSLRRTLRWRILLNLVLAFVLAGGLLYLSSILHLAGIYGWPQGVALGFLSVAGLIVGNCIYQLVHIGKL